MKMYRISAEPHPITIDPARTALLVIDMQKDFLYPGGFGAFLGNDVSLLWRAVEPTQRVLAAARKLGLLIIHTREGHLPDLSDCPPSKLERWSPGTRIGDLGPMGRILIQGEVGHAIIDELAPLPGEVVLDKPGKNSFYATNLDALLKAHAVKTLLVTGVTTDVCVFTTVTGANDHGYDALVVADCVASYSPERHRAALETIKAQGGIFGWVSNAEQVLMAIGDTLTDRLLADLDSSHQQLTQLLASFAHKPDRQPAPGQWSFREIAAHMAEAEEDCLWKRIRLIAAGGQPHFDFYENSGDDFSQLDLLASLARWATARKKVLDFVASLSAEQRSFTATHTAFGTITVADYLREFYQHDVEHLHDLEKQLEE